MHVSGVDVPQQPNNEAAANRKQEPTGDLFATFLKHASGTAFSTIRLAAGSDLSKQIVADAPGPRTEDAPGPRTEDVKPQAKTGVDEGDADAQPEAAESDRPSNDDDAVLPQPAAADTAGAPQAEALSPAGEDAFPKDIAQISPLTPIAPDTPGTSGEISAAVENAGVADTIPRPRDVAASQTANSDPGKSIAVAGNRHDAAAQTASLQVPQQSVADAEGKPPPAAAHNGANRLTAQVTETPQQVVSRPSNYLATATVVAAQSEKPRPAGTAAGNPNGDSADRTGNLLLNNPTARSAQAAGAHRAASQNAPNPPAAPQANAANPATPAQTTSFSATLAANQSAIPLSSGGQATTGLARGAGEPVSFTAPNGLTAPSSASVESARTAAPSRPPIPPRVLTDQISVQIRKSVGQGEDHIKIQLKPAELGRVEIKLDVAHDGRVHATITADRPETLDLLQRDARGLQQALHDAGLKSDNGSLSFNLGGGNASGQERASVADGRGDTAQGDEEIQPLAVGTAETETPLRLTGDGSVDMRV